MKTVLAAVLCLSVAAVCRGQHDRIQAITSVDIIDVETGRILHDRTVVIEGSRIHSIDASLVPTGSDVIDGEGLYLMPGLIDAHVHLSAAPQVYATMLVAHGVVCVRDTGADTETILSLRANHAASGSIAPRIVCTGAIIDGDPPVWPFSEACSTPEQGRDAVRRLVAAGVDQLKVYSLLRPEVYLAILDEARTSGIKVTGHVPNAMTVEQALEAGQHCNEHLMRFPEALAALAGEETGTNALLRGTSWSVLDRVAEDDLDAFVERVREAGMVQCPTLAVFQGYGRTLDGDRPGPEELKYTPSFLTSMWRSIPETPMARTMKEGLPFAQKLIGRMHNAGVTILAGTDLANPYVFAGRSLHEELQLLEESGLSPLDALRAATSVPAEFMGIDGDLGVIRQGASACMVLVSANPLESIANTSRIEGVFVRGTYLDRNELDRMMAEVAGDTAGQPVNAAAEPNTPIRLEIEGEIVARGRYLMRFGDFDAGEESFVIGRDEEGYLVRVKSSPRGGPQQPTSLDARFSRTGVFESGRWIQHSDPSLEALYTMRTDSIVTEAKRDGTILPAVVTDLPDDALVAPPMWATEFCTYRRIELQPKETATYSSVSWGFPNHEPSVAEYTITRLDDETLDHNGNDVAVQHYATRLKMAIGEFSSKTWIRASDGVMLRTEMTMPFGTLFVSLE